MKTSSPHVPAARSLIRSLAAFWMLTVTPVAPALEMETGGNPLSTMMWTMADIMGLLSGGDGQALPGIPSMPGGMGLPMTPAMPMNPLSSMPGLNRPTWGSGMPWKPPGGSAWNPMDPTRRWMGNPASVDHGLSGLWRGSSGELLAVRGNQYHLQSGDNRRASGQIYLRGDWIILSNPEQQVTQRFEYLRNSSTLILRGDSGQMLIFRRVRPGHSQADAEADSDGEG